MLRFNKDYLVSLREESSLERRLRTCYTLSPSGCWEYNGTRDPYGYGKISVGSKRYGAHKVSYAFYKGEVPRGKVVMHSCDNPCCVNPDHLSVGSVRDNTMDSLSKGRSHNPSSVPKPVLAVDIHNPNESIMFRSISAARCAGFSSSRLTISLNSGIPYKDYEWFYLT